MHTIEGQVNVVVGTNLPYSITPADGLGYTWIVTGGTITSGQGTASIIIHWTTIGPGQVQVEVQTGGEPNIVVIDTNAE